MREDMDEELPLWFQRLCDFGHEELVVLHVLEEFDRDHPVERLWLKFVGNHVSSNDFQVRQTFLRRLSFNVSTLCP